MSPKPEWEMPRLIAINPFGGANANPYEYDGTYYPTGVQTVVFTGGLGDATVVSAGPGGNITDYDPDVGYGGSAGPFYYSTVAPYS